MSDEYKARISELMNRHAEQMLDAFDQPVVNVHNEFTTICAPILTTDIGSGVLFVLDA